jgi:tetratricopeptide (TPR) repeat protein
MIGRRALVLWLCLGGGCALRRSPGLAEHFVKGAGGSAQSGVTFDVPHESGESKLGSGAVPGTPAVPPLPTPKFSDLPSVEKQDRALAGAIAALAALPSGGAHRRVAAEYLRLSIFDAAYDHLMEALKIDPRDSAAYDALARLWRDAGMPGLSLSPSYRAIYLAPKWAGARNTLGTVLYALGDPDGARQSFSRALSLDPGAGYVLNNLCYMSLVRGDLWRARAECDEAVRLAPELPAARANSAAVMAAAGR